MIKDLTIFALAHLGAFMVIRDVLETSGIRAIQDANGMTDATEANFAQLSGEYILPKEDCSNSETVNYFLFGDRLAKYLVQQLRSGRIKNDIEAVVQQVRKQLGKEQVTEEVTIIVED